MNGKNTYKLITGFLLLSIIFHFHTNSANTQSSNIDSQCEYALAGDMNCDGTVDIQDFNLLRSEFVKFRETGNLSGLKSNFNSDTQVDIEDFNIFRNAFSIFRSGTMPSILTRQTSSGPEFYNSLSKKSFLARGNNYIRLEPINNSSGQFAYYYHSNFNVGVYDRNRSLAALTEMSNNKYNTVRVFISDIRIGKTAGGLDENYIKNVVDFLNLAKSKKIYVVITLPNLPVQGNYYPSYRDPNFQAQFNEFILNGEFVKAKQRYLKDFINGLKTNNAPLDTIFSYNIENEVFFDESLKPLSLTSGNILTGDGKTFNMAIPDDKKRMMDSNIVNYIDKLKAAIREVDSTRMVGVGFFSPHAVSGPTDQRVTRTYSAILDQARGGSSADYIDLHVYYSSNLRVDFNSFEITPSVMTDKPMIVGEYGYLVGSGSVQSAAISLRDMQIITCKEYRAKGWLVWTWDSEEQVDLYNVLSSSGAINGLLAPIVRPDPCI